MDLIDRLRPRWRHPDPALRAAAVRELPAEEGERLATIACDDPDPGVRTAALERLDDVGVLARRAADDGDPAVRARAAERLREVRIAVATSARPPAECEAALAELDDGRALVAVAAGAAHDAVRRAALARVGGDRSLRDVVRAAADPAIRRAALDRIGDPAVLRAIATGDHPPEVVLRAVERIDDPAVLDAIAGHRGAAKAVRQRARARLAAGGGDRPVVGVKDARARQQELSNAVHMLRAGGDVLRAAEEVEAALREWEALARQVEPKAEVAAAFASACDAILEEAGSLQRRRAEADHARQTVEDSVAARGALCDRVEAADDGDVPGVLAAARAAWSRLAPVPDAEGVPLWRRFSAACEQATARHAAWRERRAQRAGLEQVVEDAEALADATPPASAKAWKEVERRWEAPEHAAADREALAARFAAARERLQGRRQEAEADREGRERENLARLDALWTRLRELSEAERLKPSAARRELQAVEAALADLGPLPPSERRAEWTARLGEGRDALLRRVAREEEAEEWRRWANVGAQEEIIARVEGLLAAGDLAEGSRQLGRLQEEWAAVATASPEKSQALWERFRTARNELRRRCDAYMAENLEKKRALCAQVAGVGDATAWNETADLVRRAQAEWKAIGPVPAKHAKALWQEFRAPCDRFFARRKEHFARLDAERGEHAKQKLALCEQAEGLADSTDWDATTDAVKRLQAEWKRGGAPPREQADALWQRFRTACDRFFDRRSRRHELAREEALRKAAGVCDDLEALAASLDGAGAGADPGASDDAGAADGAGPRLDAGWAEWVRLELPASEAARALDGRVRAACERIAAARPESLRGTRLDPETTRKRREKLCARLEALAGPAAEAPRPASLQEMALALRDRLASNTIAGGAGRAGTSRQDVAREVERIAASWAHLGPPLDDAARALAERFERARARVSPASG